MNEAVVSYAILSLLICCLYKVTNLVVYFKFQTWYCKCLNLRYESIWSIIMFDVAIISERQLLLSSQERVLILHPSGEYVEMVLRFEALNSLQLSSWLLRSIKELVGHVKSATSDPVCWTSGYSFLMLLDREGVLEVQCRPFYGPCYQLWIGLSNDRELVFHWVWIIFLRIFFSRFNLTTISFLNLRVFYINFSTYG